MKMNKIKEKIIAAVIAIKLFFTEPKPKESELNKPEIAIVETINEDFRND